MFFIIQTTSSSYKIRFDCLSIVICLCTVIIVYCDIVCDMVLLALSNVIRWSVIPVYTNTVYLPVVVIVFDILFDVIPTSKGSVRSTRVEYLLLNAIYGTTWLTRMCRFG